VSAVTPAPQEPVAAVENVRRGTLFALIAIPVGVAAWMVIWGLGFIAALVAALVAFLAVRLYVAGAKGFSRVGAVVVLLVTVVTLLLAFFGGVVLDAAVGLGEATGLGTWGAFTHAEFWPTFWEIAPEAAPDYTRDLLLALGFGALGSFVTLRAAFAAAREGGAVAAPAAEAAPEAAAVPEAPAPEVV
jgi:asparagine N-glycosylation enzyme membrane subunit Stt3